MTAFLEKHILFPKRLGSWPYFFLFFAIPSVVLTGIYEPLALIWTVPLTLIFLKAYRDCYLELRLQSVLIQLVIAAFLTLTLPGFGYFFIYPSWPVGARWKYVRLFFIISVGALVLSNLLHPGDANYLVNSGIALIQVIIFPYMARAISGMERRELKREKQLERERIAADLHDTLGQKFSIITMKSELASKLLEKETEKDLERARAELLEITQTSRESLNLVREIVSGLKEMNLAQALSDAKKYLTLAGMALQIEGDELAAIWPDTTQTVLAGVLKEAVTNILNHSQAQQVFIKFRESSGHYWLTVQDDGVGLGDKVASHGLTGMTRRVEEANGEISIQTKMGVEISVKLPVKVS